MKQKIFTIYDKKAEAYNTPWFQQTHGLAERIFRDESNNPESSINKHPEDYTLYYLGEYDQNTGEMEIPHPPKPVMEAVEAQNITD